jgi:hypothetical protein
LYSEYQRRDIKRLFAYSSIEHMGLITFAFGMGGPLANFAGLLHMVMQRLTKSAIFFSVGDVAQAKGTQKLADSRGLSASNPVLAVGLMDRIVPGGVACDLDDDCCAAILALMENVEASFVRVARVYDQPPSLQNRTVGTLDRRAGVRSGVRCRRLCRPPRAAPSTRGIYVAKSLST